MILGHGCIPCHLEHQLLAAFWVIGPVTCIAWWRIHGWYASIKSYLLGRYGHVDGCAACEHSDATHEVIHGAGHTTGYKSDDNTPDEGASVAAPPTQSFCDGVWVNVESDDPRRR